jgi:hypothetical protein
LNRGDTLAYLTEVGRYPARVQASPEVYLPWNYATARAASLN